MSFFPSDLPTQKHAVYETLLMLDGFVVRGILLEDLESIPKEQRARTLDQARWNLLPQAPIKDDYLSFECECESQEFANMVTAKLQRISDNEKALAQRKLHAMLSELAEKPTCEEFAKIAQFAADQGLELKQMSQFTPLFDGLHKVELERKDEEAWYKAEEADSISGYEGYLNLDLPLRHKYEAESRLASLNSEEEQAWGSISQLFDSEATTGEEQLARYRLVSDYLISARGRWRCTRTDERYESISRHGTSLLEQFRNSEIEAHSVWWRALSEGVSEAVRPVMEDLARVRFDAISGESSIAQLLDYLSEPAGEQFHAECRERIRSQVSVDTKGKSELLIKVGKLSLSFIRCHAGVVQVSGGHNERDSHHEYSAARELVCRDELWFLETPIGVTECREILSKQERDAVSEACIPWSVANLLHERISKILDIAEVGYIVRLPTENQWEYAVTQHLEIVENLMTLKYEWCRDDFLPFAKTDLNSSVETQLCRKNVGGNRKVLKGGYCESFPEKAGSFLTDWCYVEGYGYGNLCARAAGTTELKSHLVTRIEHRDPQRRKERFGLLDFGSRHRCIENRYSGTWDYSTVPGVAVRLVAIQREGNQNE